MKLNEDQRKALAIGRIAQNFNCKFPDALMLEWLSRLGAYPAALVEEAAGRLIDSRVYAGQPPFAALKEIIDSICGPADAETLALAEYGRLLEAIRGRGRDRGMPDDMHPATRQTLRLMGGWAAACAWKEGDPFARRDFLSLWAQVYERLEYIELGADDILELMAKRRARLGMAAKALGG